MRGSERSEWSEHTVVLSFKLLSIYIIMEKTFTNKKYLNREELSTNCNPKVMSRYLTLAVDTS